MNILLAVCGSVSAYKSYDLARGYVKAGHSVRVILTKGAEQFIKPQTFLYLGVEEVYTYSDDFNSTKKINNVLHIDLKNWLSKLVIAPASANTIAKLANGFCDDLLSSVFLSAFEKDIILYPSMNTQMYLNPITQKNISALAHNKNCFIHTPANGLLACEEVGIGKLPDIEDILIFTQVYNSKETPRNILINTGATVAVLDPVRYLTNPASGKTGFELTKKYLQQGCSVTLVYGKNSTFNKTALKEHPRLKMLEVSTTQEMYQIIEPLFSHADVFISSAAISDIEFEVSCSKIKKDLSDNNLNFTWAQDILSEMIKRKKHQKIISFAAESDSTPETFLKKWNKKPTDLMVGNIVNNGLSNHNPQPQGFSQDSNEYYFINNKAISSPIKLSKRDLSEYIFNFTENNESI